MWHLWGTLHFMSITIFDTDTVEMIATKIWEKLNVGSSIDIYGWATNEISQQLSPVGDLVLEWMKHLDEADNIIYRGKLKKRQRQFIYEPKSIGGPLAQKIFKFNKVFLDNNPRVTIWRIQ